MIGWAPMRVPSEICGFQPRAYARLDPIFAQYRVPGMGFEALARWYDMHLPIKQSWRQWRWCESWVGKMIIQRTYYQPSSTMLLSVVITRDDPPGILISLDKRETC